MLVSSRLMKPKLQDELRAITRLEQTTNLNMAGRLGFPRSPLCLSCMRRIAGDGLPQLSPPSLTQIRGKKKTAKKITTINVRLLADIKGYGRKGGCQISVLLSPAMLIESCEGSITPVAPGRMRNTWYPRQQAEYISTLQAKPRDIIAERDFSFGVQSQARQEVETAPKAMEQPKVVVARTKLLPVRNNRTDANMRLLKIYSLKEQLRFCCRLYRATSYSTEPPL